MKRHFTKDDTFSHATFHPIPENNIYNRYLCQLRFAWPELYNSDEGKRVEKFLDKLWFVNDDYIGKNICEFWIMGDGTEKYIPNLSRPTNTPIKTVRRFRKALKNKYSKILPNGTKIMMDYRYQIKISGKYRDCGVLGTIKNNLTVEDSERIIRKQMSDYVKIYGR